MARSSAYIQGIALVGACVLALASCSHPSESKSVTPSAPAQQVAASVAGVQQAQLPPVQQPTVQTATITFLTGDVEETSSSTWTPANIGDTVAAGDRVRVGADSYCELQFGNLAMARIEANSEVAISRLELGASRQVAVGLNAGAIVSKVQKLAGQDRYQIQTQTAVAGVRGTEFRVAASNAGQTDLSVKEGVVTVIPPQAIIAASTPAQQAVAQQVEEAVTAGAPTVTANQQLVVTTADFASVVGTLDKVKQQIAAGATVAAVKPLVDASVSAAVKSVPKPVAMSPAQQTTLAVTDTMNLLPTPSPAQAAQSGGASTPAAAAQPHAVQVSLSAAPGNAAIYLNDQLVGTKGFSGIFVPGQKLTLSVRLAGYERKDFNIDVPENGVALTVELIKTPAAPAAQPSQTAAAPPSAAAKAPTQAQPAAPSRPTAAAAKPVAPSPLALTVNVTPATAELTVNGRPVGSGSYQGSYPPGTQITVEAHATGYAPQTRTIDLASATTADLSLRPQPIQATLSVSSSPLVRSLAVWNGNIISVDQQAVLRSSTPEGALNWQVSTANNPNSNSRPVVGDGEVFLSGARQFVGVDAASGTRLFAVTLGQSDAHLFGRSVEVENGKVYYPTNTEIAVYNEKSGRVERRITLPSQSNMSALLSGGDLYIVDQQGTLYELNSQNGKTIAQVASTAVQPVASAPILKGSDLFFAGRRGTAVLADMRAGKILWQKPLDPSQSVGVFTDPVFGSGAVYVFAKDTIYALSLASGSNLFAPISGVSATPLVDGETLYYGTTGGRLVKADAQTGTVQASVAVGSPITTSPIRVGEDIAVGTASGKIVLVYPGTMGAP